MGLFLRGDAETDTLVGAVSLFIGTIPGAFGLPVWSLFIIGFSILYFIIVKLGKKVIVEENILK